MQSVLMLGFAGAFQKSEVAALNVEDLEFCDEGVRVQDRPGGKGPDDRGPARRRSVLSGAAAAMAGRSWHYRRCTVPAGAEGRRARRGFPGAAITDVTKRGIEAVGLDASKLGSHSMRSGWILTAAMNGASVWTMKEISGHKSPDVLAGYIHAAELFEQHASVGIVLRGRNGGTALARFG
jgi:integrase